MGDFAESFGDADKLLLTEVYAASEPEIPGANSAALAEAIRARGQVVDYVPALRDVVPAVRAVLQPGDLVLFLGAGDITKAAHELVRQLKTGMRAPAARAEANAMNEIGKKFRNALSAETIVREGEPLAKRTTLRVGGKADFFVEPANEDDLSATLRLCAELKLPFTIIGRGSNLLIKDGGIRGVVISLGHESFSRVQIIGEHLHTGAGAKLKTVSVEARRAGLAGLEFLEGIPGSVGGALRMNAGAMGSWMFEVVEQIRFMDFSGVAHERQGQRSERGVSRLSSVQNAHCPGCGAARHACIEGSHSGAREPVQCQALGNATGPTERRLHFQESRPGARRQTHR